MSQSTIPVFLATDDNYAHLLLTTMLSIADHTKTRCNFYILDGGISPEKKAIIEDQLHAIPNITFAFFPMKEKVQSYGFLTTGHITMPAYYRFFIADAFPSLEKAVYLDVDVIFLGDIQDLYTMDMGGFIIGAVQEQTSERNLHVIKENMGLAEDCVYFNDGVLLMDLSRWRREGITEKLLEIEKKHHGRLILNDEDVINVCFEKNYLNLGLAFNSTEQYDSPCTIRHYAGFPKPWEIRPELCTGEFSQHRFFWDYLRRTPFYDEILARCKYSDPIQLKKMAMIKKIMFKQEVREKK